MKESKEKYNITSIENYVIIKLNWRIDKWFLEFILSLGDNVEVLEPEELRNEIIQRIKKLVLMLVLIQVHLNLI